MLLIVGQNEQKFKHKKIIRRRHIQYVKLIRKKYTLSDETVPLIMYFSRCGRVILQNVINTLLACWMGP
jgi:hypothetical protein